MNLQVNKETETQYHPLFLKILEDIPGGITLVSADLKTVTEEIKAGALLGEDPSTAGKFHLVKTAKVYEAEAASGTALKVFKTHEFKAGDFITNGQVSTEITSITTTETLYDTINLTATLDAKEEVPVNSIVYQGSSETTNVATASEAQVIDEATEILDITNPRGINGCKITISQAGGDTLAVASPADGELTIALANSTPANNNVAAIQTAVRALGVVGTVNFSDWGFASDGWDGNVTGTGLTVPSDYLASGVEKPAALAAIYPADSVLISNVDVSGTNPNVIAGAVIRGSVKESLLPFYVPSVHKTALTNRIKFV